MASPNYSFEKRKKEIAKKEKQQQKLKQKQQQKLTAQSEPGQDDVSIPPTNELKPGNS